MTHLKSQIEMSHPIYTCLWFESQARQAADFYCSIFKNSKITSENPIVVNIEINGTKLMLLNGNSDHVFSPSTSLVVECDTQEEIDHYWEKLGEGGTYSMCGWLDDKNGISWQIVPKVLGQLMADPARSQRVVNAFLKMQKFDIQTLLDA
jgi:predicted 3-demethylubiquinone-9 3-methyltransferase (glyoxalase superfamily)